MAEVLVSTGGAARRLGGSLTTVRNYERTGVLVPAMRLEGSDRRVWREADLVEVARRPTPIQPVRIDEGPPLEAA